MNTRYLINIDERLVQQIKEISYLRQANNSLDIEGTLDFFTRRYVQPLANTCDISKLKVFDCAAGLGWFSVASVLGGGKGAVAVDVDSKRIEAAKEIATILSVADRIDFIVSSIESIPVDTNETDIFVSIETLEHVGVTTARMALQKMADVVSKAVLITTPNKFFPMVAHDTRLPGIHWLAPKNRKLFARVFGREDKDESNEFLSPVDLNVLLDKFYPASTCLTFQSYSEFRSHYPYYLPYGREEARRLRVQPSLPVSLYYRSASTILGPRAYWAMPNLASIFLRR